VSAFWPFSQSADAATSSTLPSATTPVLVASTNQNPDPSAPTVLNVSTGSALIAQSGPSGTLSDVEEIQKSGRISVYVVRSGDSLSDIAKMFGVSVNTILWANGLKSSRDVHTGDTLIILPVSGVERKIVSGDTLKSLAKRYGADANEIAQFNGLDPADPLTIGDTIIIPGGELASAPATPATRKPSKNIREPYLGGSGAAYDGYYSSPIYGAPVTQGIHGWNGIDLGAARGTPVRAAADGTAIIARGNGGWNGGYGNYVVITHSNGSQTLYAHLKAIAISPGQSVSAGKVVGYVGSTGLSTGPHLHFEVRGAANPFRNCTIGSVCIPE
jgi:LysM repeat protein